MEKPSKFNEIFQMDSTMTAINQSNNESNIKAADEEHIHQRSARSVSHGRPPSASGIRTKIPMNINQSRPASSLANAQSVACTQDDSTSPTTLGNTTRRLTRSHNSALSKAKQGVTPGGMRKRWLENQFKKEKKRYLTVRKELDEKQKCAQQMFDDMSQLREKLIADGGEDPGKIDEIKLNFNHADKQSGDQNINQANAIINRGFISIIENELKCNPKDCTILCDDVIKKNIEMLKWMENFGKSNEKFGKEINQHMENYKTDIKLLNGRLESGKKIMDDFNNALLEKVMMMWAEIETIRTQIRQVESMSNDAGNDLRMKLNAEIGKFNQLKEKKMTMESDLMKSKASIQALEIRVNADETKIGQLQSHIKNLEVQLKQKDRNLENSMRDFHKSLKHSEETIVSLETQKDNLESRLSEMKDQLETEKKRRVDKSPRVQEITKRTTEDNTERDKDTKKKVGELETLVEALREEVTCNKKLIVKLQNEKSSSELQLKEELAKEQAQATKLMESYEQLKNEHESMQQKTKTLNSQLLALRHNDYDTKNIKEELDPIEFIQLTEALRQEIADLKCENRDLEAQLQHQIQNLEIKNQMIAYLKEAHSEEINSDEHQVNKEIDSKAVVLQELYHTLETKQMQLTHLENVLKQMEGQEMRNQEQRTRYEKRIAQLEYDVQMKKTKDCRYVLDFSIPHSSSKQNEIEKALELERKYQRLKKESWQMESIYNKLIEATVRSVRSREVKRHLRGSCRDKEYAYCSSVEPRHVDVGCYVHQVVDQCGRELGGGSRSCGRQKAGYWSRSPHRIRRKM